MPARRNYWPFESNPYTRYPGGRTLNSDISDAGMRMAAERPARSPGPMGSPRVEVINRNWQPRVATWEGRPIVETGLDIYPGRDEWWRQPGRVSGNAEGSAGLDTSGAGGSIWEDTPMIESRGGRSPNLIDDPSLDWTGTDPVVGQPTVETPTEPALPQYPDEPLFPDITPPDQSVNGDASAGAGLDPLRRVQGSATTGPDIRSFANNLTLGEFFNTPLADMHYGEGYPPVGGGTVRYAGTERTQPGDAPLAGADTEAERRGIEENPDLYEQGGRPSGYEEPPTGRPASPEVRRGQPADMYWDWTSGSFRPFHSVATARDPGSKDQLDPNQLSAGLTSSNFTGTTGDEGHTSYALQRGMPTWVWDEENQSMSRTGPIHPGNPHFGSRITSGMTPQQIAYARELLANDFAGSNSVVARSNPPPKFKSVDLSQGK